MPGSGNSAAQQPTDDMLHISQQFSEACGVVGKLLATMVVVGSKYNRLKPQEQRAVMLLIDTLLV